MADVPGTAAQAPDVPGTAPQAPGGLDALGRLGVLAGSGASGTSGTSGASGTFGTSGGSGASSPSGALAGVVRGFPTVSAAEAKRSSRESAATEGPVSPLMSSSYNCRHQSSS
ncbi:hypothetical protein [Streptomyces sp. 1222.2]|uniref:hypothetical protein n=1 Tax=Streptomyces sp. 1222.2 TaxID=1938833 RepID=UPI00211CFF8D|nr:hypothetical protein [Streptomyces sp. 1222.2]